MVRRRADSLSAPNNHPTHPQPALIHFGISCTVASSPRNSCAKRTDSRRARTRRAGCRGGRHGPRGHLICTTYARQGKAPPVQRLLDRRGRLLLPDGEAPRGCGRAARKAQLHCYNADLGRQDCQG
jgi:hypothetical protein